MRLRDLAAALVLGGGLIATAAHAQSTAPAPAARVGQLAPDFTLPDSTGPDF